MSSELCHVIGNNFSHMHWEINFVISFARKKILMWLYQLQEGSYLPTYKSVLFEEEKNSAALSFNCFIMITV